MDRTPIRDGTMNETRPPLTTLESPGSAVRGLGYTLVVIAAAAIAGVIGAALGAARIAPATLISVVIVATLPLLACVLLLEAARREARAAAQAVREALDARAAKAEAAALPVADHAGRLRETAVAARALHAEIRHDIERWRELRDELIARMRDAQQTFARQIRIQHEAARLVAEDIAVAVQAGGEAAPAERPPNEAVDWSALMCLFLAVGIDVEDALPAPALALIAAAPSGLVRRRAVREAAADAVRRLADLLRIDPEARAVADALRQASSRDMASPDSCARDPRAARAALLIEAASVEDAALDKPERREQRPPGPAASVPKPRIAEVPGRNDPRPVRLHHLRDRVEPGVIG